MKRIALIALALMVLVPANAIASGDTVIEDCADDGELSRPYSQSEYKQALADLPADLDEYTDCRATIRAAQLRRASRGSSDQPRGSNRSKRDSEKEKRKLEEAAKSDAPLKIGKSVIRPASLNSSATIPTPLIVVLVLTLLGALGASAIAIRRIVINRRNR